jgi:hypothetical protein
MYDADVVTNTYDRSDWATIGTTGVVEGCAGRFETKVVHVHGHTPTPLANAAVVVAE